MFSFKKLGLKLSLCLIVLALVPARSLAQAGTPAKPGENLFIPLTHKEHLHEYFQHLFSLESVVRSAASAGIDQWMNSPHEWGQGAQGYGLRFASSYGEHLIQSTVMYGTSEALHEDNRYFLSGRSGFKARLKYAIASTFQARRDDGSTHLSISRMSSYVAAAVVSRSWQPPSTSGPIHAADSVAIAVAVETGFNVAREFFPGVLHSHRPVGGR